MIADVMPAADNASSVRRKSAGATIMSTSLNSRLRGSSYQWASTWALHHQGRELERLHRDLERPTQRRLAVHDHYRGGQRIHDWSIDAVDRRDPVIERHDDAVVTRQRDHGTRIDITADAHDFLVSGSGVRDRHQQVA
jgi:hypothetical protein